MDDIQRIRTKTLIHHHEECIKVKDEDADWLIYHLVAEGPSTTVDELVLTSGLDTSEVDKSLGRLERNLLIEQREGRVRVLTIGESLLLCQINYSKDLPYTIENGVVREREK
jgi:predicted transcriptional regulator